MEGKRNPSVNVASKGPRKPCASVCVPGSPVGYPARGAEGVAEEWWKAAASALWYGLLLPGGQSLPTLRPNGHRLKYY